MELITLGNTWSLVLDEGKKRNLLTFQEITAVNKIINMIQTGNIPSTNTGRLPQTLKTTVLQAIEAKEKVAAEGLLKN